ncbi:DUF1642 domain-containing protein [Pediococcus acidilactici]|uniref:DUF1642 domain-containing protein n=1 Tax=Pediococcus acidilactici TaxID=1254 RepID=UPI00132A9E6A|nr:DUF1642 domain-containing protein [Pediococcus acidilactici]KAF0336869.1 DUF1642 domain-containing protein [Pediococcus acidilactici]KAF0348474.1 DUF1642 domain-containing protein [Pediococcus acidilactici]KAF0462120.1 DUF1642 domain-containing protein [Pediococcus acidilactici]KAF0502985.1 DUF1642 domain-containing protein [Pediococcus acidilactici]KAF0512187.1 DUF1642 domain-containing protein [Pediococcus acidilactici]
MELKKIKNEIRKLYDEKSVWTQWGSKGRLENLLDELDESQKVTITQCVANLIEKSKTYGLRTPLSTAYYIAESLSSGDKHYQWLKDENNQRLLLNAIANGYEVEKPIRVVKLKGIHGLRKYVRLNDEGKVILGLKGSDGITGGVLTEDEAKEKWPEFGAYNHAGLLEFEEIEDD